MKLSIIIAACNVGPWVARCLASCIRQGLASDDYEIIVVNDGSTDDTKTVVESFRTAATSSGAALHWQIIEQPNRGLSAARNAGLLAATGEYVWWIDGDDFVEPDRAARLVERAEREHLDVLCFGLDLYTDEKPPRRERLVIRDETRGAVVDGKTFMLQTDMTPAAWCALYRRDFLLAHNLRFLEGAYHEDQDFTPRAYFWAERIAYEDIVVYDYVQRPDSIMNTPNPKKSDDLLRICDRLWDFSLQHTPAGSPIRTVFVNRVSFLFSQALSNLCRCGIFEFPGDCKALPYYPLSLNKQLTQKERYKYRLINSSVPLYMKLYRKFNSQKVNPKRRLRTR